MKTLLSIFLVVIVGTLNICNAQSIRKDYNEMTEVEALKAQLNEER